MAGTGGSNIRFAAVGTTDVGRIREHNEDNFLAVDLAAAKRGGSGEVLSGEVRGKGLMIGIEFKSPKSLKLKAAWAMIHAANKGLFGQMIVVPLMAKHRVLTQVAGHNIDLVKLLPPLVVTEADVEYFAKSLAEVVADCHKFPGAAWETGMMLAKNAMASRKGVEPKEIALEPVLD